MRLGDNPETNPSVLALKALLAPCVPQEQYKGGSFVVIWATEFGKLEARGFGHSPVEIVFAAGA